MSNINPSDYESEIKWLKDIINRQYLDKLLIVEWSSDAFFIKLALKYLSKKQQFIIVPANSCSWVRFLLDALWWSNRKTIGLFDFDLWFNEWNSIWYKKKEKNFKYDCLDPVKGLCKKHDIFDSYALMIPIPSSNDLSSQVIKQVKKEESSLWNEIEKWEGTLEKTDEEALEKGKFWTYWTHSEFEIESLFYKKVPIDSCFFTEDKYPWSSIVVPNKDSKNNKVRKYIEDNISNKEIINESFFEYFKLLIEKIETLFSS